MLWLMCATLLESLRSALCRLIDMLPVGMQLVREIVGADVNLIKLYSFEGKHRARRTK